MTLEHGQRLEASKPAIPPEGTIVEFQLSPREYIPTTEPSFTNLQAFVAEAASEGAHFLVEEESEKKI